MTPKDLDLKDESTFIDDKDKVILEVNVEPQDPTVKHPVVYSDTKEKENDGDSSDCISQERSPTCSPSWESLGEWRTSYYGHWRHDHREKILQSPEQYK